MNTSLSHPVCIASPVRRSGTTLIQRLLCSSSNALIYGETCANDLQILSSLLTNKEMLLKQGEGWRNRQLKSVLEGEVNSWIPDLMPEISGYLEAYKNLVLSLSSHYANSATDNNRPIWGMKMPEWNPANLVLIQKILPEAKIIYLHRGIEDCVRSAKKMGMIAALNEVQQFCHTWKQFYEYANIHLKGDKVLHLNFEDLVDAPELWINKIETFTGAQNIDRSVMDVKINTFENDHKLEIGAGPYLEPSELSEEELELINAFNPKVDTV